MFYDVLATVRYTTLWGITSRTGVRYDTSCWSRSSFGTALIEVETRASTRGTLDLRADLRILYAQGGPWHETQWPARSGR